VSSIEQAPTRIYEPAPRGGESCVSKFQRWERIYRARAASADGSLREQCERQADYYAQMVREEQAR
jgi:hypothetical protein